MTALIPFKANVYTLFYYIHASNNNIMLNSIVLADGDSQILCEHQMEVEHELD